MSKSTVGDYIKKLRKSKNLTQEELGKIVGVQRAAVQKWESGQTHNLKRDTIQKLSNFFNVSPSSFFDADWSVLLALSLEEGNEMSFDEKYIYNACCMLNEDGIKKVEDYINVLLGNPKYTNGIIKTL